MMALTARQLAYKDFKQLPFMPGVGAMLCNLILHVIIAMLSSNDRL